MQFLFQVGEAAVGLCDGGLRRKQGDVKSAHGNSGGCLGIGVILLADERRLLLEDVMANCLADLFPGMEIVSVHPFRIIRDADVEIQEIEADDLLETMEQSIRRRRFGSVVQVAVYESMPENIRRLLLDNLRIRSSDLFVHNKPLGLAGLWQLYDSVERHELKYLRAKSISAEEIVSFRNDPQVRSGHNRRHLC